MAATLHLHLRDHWRQLKRGHPGRRFEERYECVHRGPRHGRFGERMVAIVLAVICLLIAAALSVLPGPALPFFFIGGGLLATESRTVARVMDRCEVGVRRFLAWGKRRWRRLSFPLRVAVVMGAVVLSLSTSLVSLHLLRR